MKIFHAFQRLDSGFRDNTSINQLYWFSLWLVQMLAITLTLSALHTTSWLGLSPNKLISQTSRMPKLVKIERQKRLRTLPINRYYA